jgi:agmatinase
VRPPQPHPFLAAEAAPPTPDAGAIVAGLASDGGVSFRAGAAEGPAGIRTFSESIESYSPRTGMDLADLRLIDAGDHTGPPAEGEAAIGALVEASWRDGRRPTLALLGGDHSVTPPAVRAVAARSADLTVIGFDAHLDLREDYPGDHACTYRRISDGGVPCVVLGPRSGARSEWEDVPSVLAHCSRELEVPRSLLEGRDIYVSVDIDVLDPSVAPGTGNPEPGGPGFVELLECLESLQRFNVVAFDVVEVSPPLDPSGITQAAAAVIVRELLLRFAGR